MLPSLIETVCPGLRLKIFKEADAQALFNLIDQNRAHLSQFGDRTSAKYPTLKSVHDSIASPSDPKRMRFGIWWKEELVGSINVTPRLDLPNLLEIGYWVSMSACEKRIATRATQALVCAIRRSGKATHVVAWTHPQNVASKRVLAKAGLALSGHCGEEAWFSLKL